MNIDDDYDNDGNNIVPCPICDDVYCPSKEDGKCPQEDEFAKHYLNTPDTEETFINKVWEVLKGDHTDLNRQARILQLYRSAIISHTTYWKEQMEKAVLKGERNRIIEKIREERDTYWKERVRKEVKDALRRLDIDDHNYLTARREIAKVSGIPMMAITFNEHLKVIKEKLEATPITNNR